MSVRLNGTCPKLSFSVAKATLEMQMSVHLSVCQSVSHKNPSAAQNHACQPNLSLLAIMPVQPPDLCPAFATFKPFWLVI